MDDNGLNKILPSFLFLNGLGGLEVGSPCLLRDALMSSCFAILSSPGLPGEKVAAAAPGTAPAFQSGGKKNEGEGQKPEAFCF